MHAVHTTLDAGEEDAVCKVKSIENMNHLYKAEYRLFAFESWTSDAALESLTALQLEYQLNEVHLFHMSNALNTKKVETVVKEMENQNGPSKSSFPMRNSAPSVSRTKEGVIMTLPAKTGFSSHLEHFMRCLQLKRVLSWPSDDSAFTHEDEPAAKKVTLPSHVGISGERLAIINDSEESQSYFMAIDDKEEAFITYHEDFYAGAMSHKYPRNDKLVYFGIGRCSAAGEAERRGMAEDGENARKQLLASLRTAAEIALERLNLSGSMLTIEFNEDNCVVVTSHLLPCIFTLENPAHFGIYMTGSITLPAGKPYTSSAPAKLYHKNQNPLRSLLPLRIVAKDCETDCPLSSNAQLGRYTPLAYLDKHGFVTPLSTVYCRVPQDFFRISFMDQNNRFVRLLEPVQLLLLFKFSLSSRSEEENAVRRG